MKINEIINNNQPNKITEAEGYIIVGKSFSYLVDDIELEKHGNLQYAILLPETKIIDEITKYINPKAGSYMVQYFSYSRIVGVTCYTDFSMFPMALVQVSEIDIETDDLKIHHKFFDYPRSIFINGPVHFSPKQISGIKKIFKIDLNFLQLNEKFSKKGKHLLGNFISFDECNKIINQLNDLAIASVVIEYSE